MTLASRQAQISQGTLRTIHCINNNYLLFLFINTMDSTQCTLTDLGLTTGWGHRASLHTRIFKWVQWNPTLQPPH